IVGKDSIYGAIKLIRIKENGESTEPETVKLYKPRDIATIVSPCFWREASNKWHFWGVYILKPNRLVHCFSSDGIHWEEETLCKNSSNKYALDSSGFYSWHIACKPNYFEKRIEFMIAARTSSYENVYNVACIIFAQCHMDTPNIIDLEFKTPILNNAINYRQWDTKLYRPTFQSYRTDSGYYYKVWYSANHEKSWHIGYTDGKIPVSFSNKGLPQSVTFDSILYKSVNDSAFDLKAFATSGLDVNFSIENANIAFNSGSKCILKGIPGITKVTARQEGNSIYKAAKEVSRWLVVLNARQYYYQIVLDSLSDKSKILGVTNYSDNIAFSKYALAKSFYNNQFSISWDTKDKSLLLPDGNIKRFNWMHKDTCVDLIATVPLEDTVLCKGYKVLVKPESRLETLQRLINSMTISALGIASNEDSTGIVSNLQLTSTLGEGTKIIWQSDDTSIVSNSGIVTRPFNYSKNVTIKALVHIGPDTLSKEFNIVVKAKEIPTIAENVNKITIKPNPATTFITIDIADGKPHYVQIYDLTGKMVYEENFSGKTMVDVHSLNSGVYMINVSGIKKKFIKQ
ncbi:MAG TPA: T9SS type A sorting domain-containing protein, partial [Bacteroidales bacterium]